jgi:hypothetical protein
MEKETAPRKRRITLYASQLAACAGRHPHVTKEHALVRYMRDRHRCLWEKIMCPRMPGVAEMAKSDDAPKWMRDALASHEGFLKRTRHGTVNESVVLAKPELARRLRCKSVTPDNTYREHLLFTRGDCDVYMAGRLDALGVDRDDQTVVVEVKSRAGALRGKLKEFEKIQVLAYEFMLGCKHGWLVEDSAAGLSAHAVPWDDFEWKLVQDCLIDFVDSVLELLADEAKAEELMSRPEHVLAAYLDSNT